MLAHRTTSRDFLAKVPPSRSRQRCEMRLDVIRAACHRRDHCSSPFDLSCSVAEVSEFRQRHRKPIFYWKEQRANAVKLNFLLSKVLTFTFLALVAQVRQVLNRYHFLSCWQLHSFECHHHSCIVGEEKMDEKSWKTFAIQRQWVSCFSNLCWRETRDCLRDPTLVGGSICTRPGIPPQLSSLVSLVLRLLDVLCSFLSFSSSRSDAGETSEWRLSSGERGGASPTPETLFAVVVFNLTSECRRCKASKTGTSKLESVESWGMHILEDIFLRQTLQRQVF